VAYRIEAIPTTQDHSVRLSYVIFRIAYSSAAGDKISTYIAREACCIEMFVCNYDSDKSE